MKVLFINISIRPDAERRLLPVGLAYVMTAVRHAGIDFDFLDMDIDNLSIVDAERWLADREYDVYALGCIVTGFKYVRQLAEVIKKITPNALIIAGNTVATAIPELLLRHTGVDIAVLGEGDVTTVDVLKKIGNKEDWHTVAGIAFQENERVRFSASRLVVPRLDCLGYPDWDIFDLDKYRSFAHINSNTFSGERVVAFPLNTGRGCPFSCTFCYHAFKGQKYRRYTDSSVVSEICRLHHIYGASHIMFWDELTFPNTKSVQGLIENLGRLNFRVGWDAPCRAGLFKREHISLIRDMQAVGCDNLVFSLENANAEILASMNKKITVEAFIEQAHALWEGGVPPRTSIVFGYPQETKSSIKQTLDVCERCNIYPSVGFLLPLPGTSIYTWAQKNGYIGDEVAYLERIGDRQDLHINLTSMDDDEFFETVNAGLAALALKQGLKLKSFLKTTTYKKPKVLQSKEY